CRDRAEPFAIFQTCLNLLLLFIHYRHEDVRIFYRIAAPYTHRQSAQRAVRKPGLPRGQVMVLECRDPKCAPKIN
ncbi:MAG: hypothetical protein OXC66_09980, partial [Roseovarius sp.]|nr:hypothetical protein [Roseovarius sp.]